jgi:hypothetical protein
MGTDSGNWYKVFYYANGQQQYAVVRAATPNAAVTAAIADVAAVTATNITEVQSIDPQPVTINT